MPLSIRLCAISEKKFGISLQKHWRHEAYHWPGNVRELKKLIERAVILTPVSEYIDTPVLPKEIFQKSSDKTTPSLACGI